MVNGNVAVSFTMLVAL